MAKKNKGLGSDDSGGFFKDRFDFRPGRKPSSLQRNGLIFTIVAAIFVFVMYTKPRVPVLSKQGTKFQAILAYGVDVEPKRTPVRIDGADVGTVTNVRRADSGRGVLVTMRLSPGSSVKLHNDAHLALRWRTLLGRNDYIDLNPGSPSAPKLGDEVIPTTRTTSQVELDTALTPLNATGRKGFSRIIDEFNKGFAAPNAVAGTIDNAGPTMRPLAGGLEALRGAQPGQDLPTLIGSTSKAMGALSANEVALGDLINSGDVALGATAARSSDLAATLNTAPAALSQTRSTMVRLVKTLDEVDPLASDLKPGAKKLDNSALKTQQALNAAIPSLRDVKPTLHDLRPAVQRLRTAAAHGAPVMTSLNSTVNRAKNDFIPFLNRPTPTTGLAHLYEDIGPVISSGDSATSWGDRYGGVANFDASLVGEAQLIPNPCTLKNADPSVHSAAQAVDCAATAKLLAGILTGNDPGSTTYNSVDPATGNSVTTGPGASSRSAAATNAAADRLLHSDNLVQHLKQGPRLSAGRTK